MSVKDQERTGPQRIARDYPTVAIIRTKMHIAMVLTVVFAATGIITLMQSALDEHLWQAYNAGVASLLAAAVCAAVAATLDGQITVTEILTRRADDLDARSRSLDTRIRDLDTRFRRAESSMSDRIALLGHTENRLLHEMNGLAGDLRDVVEDELGDRRHK